MENQLRWGPKQALACSLTLLGAVLLIYFVFEYARLDLPFPIGLIVVPIDETIALTITLLFAKHCGASLKRLGLKRTGSGILAIVSVAAVPLYLLGSIIMFTLTIAFGSPAGVEAYIHAIMPRDAFQLIALVTISLALVGPVEELAFRGFVQKGFESSLGKMKGLLLASRSFERFIRAAESIQMTDFEQVLISSYVYMLSQS